MKAFVLTLALISSGAIAAPMEKMTIIYRSPLDYAAYVQKAEMLQLFHAEFNEGIRQDARNQLLQMASRFAVDQAHVAQQQPHVGVGGNHLTAPQ